jgi:hypothetical protein
MKRNQKRAMILDFKLARTHFLGQHLTLLTIGLLFVLKNIQDCIMRTHGNNTAATITHSNRDGSAPASSNNSNGPNPTPSSDSKPAAKLKLETRIESIREVIESQPTAIQTTLSDTALAMLLATKFLRDKRAGFVNLTMNQTLIPKSCNIQAKLVFPQEMKDDEKTKENIQKWDDFIKKTREELKKQIIAQGDRTVEFLEEKRIELFNERLLIIAEGFTAWFNELDGVTDTPLSNHAYGAASVYCHYKALDSRNARFSYLCVDQDDALRAFKKTYLTTASGKPLFSTAQLANITMLLPANDAPPPDPDATQTQDEDMAVDPNEPLPVPKEMDNVLYQVKEKLHDLIPLIFLDLVLTVEQNQRQLKANAKLEATLKKKKTLDLAKVLEADQATQEVVAPENMKELVNSLVNLQLEKQAKEKTKELLNQAFKEARKKSLGGAKAAKTPPGKHGHGGSPKGNLKRVSFGTTNQPSKRAKKSNTQNPESDHKRLARQQQPPNPYANRNNNNHQTFSHAGRGRSPGRGQGRGQS